MPQIKTLVVNNGSADVTYTPAGSDANSTVFVNRGNTLRGISRISTSITPAALVANVQRSLLKLDKKKEVTVDNTVVVQDVSLYSLGIVLNGTTGRDERLAALREFISLLNDPDVQKYIVDHESFF